MTVSLPGARPPATPSMEDVARAAGVSTATVSRALRGLTSVSLPTRDRIVATARALGYVTSPSAASLASGRTRTIGLLTPWADRWFSANVIDGAERALRAVGFDALLYTFDVAHVRPRPPVDPSVLRRRVDGALVVGLPLAASEVAALESLGVPLAFVGTGCDGHVTVRLDDAAAGRCAMEHLLALGHRRIGHVSGHPEEDCSWSPPVARRASWAAALLDAGVQPDPGWAVDGDFDVQGGRRATHELLDRAPETTALFAASDEMAMGALLAARDRGLRVPEDLSVVGIDGHEMAEVAGLTTVSQDPGAQGAQAAGLLLNLIAAAGGEVREGTTILHPTRLVVRSSTAAPRRA